MSTKTDELAMAALQGALGTWKGQLREGIEKEAKEEERNALEETLLRRTENLNRLNRENKYKMSDSGFVTEEGRVLTVEQAENFSGVKVNAHDFNRKRTIAEAKEDAAIARELRTSPEAIEEEKATEGRKIGYKIDLWEAADKYDINPRTGEPRSIARDKATRIAQDKAAKEMTRLIEKIEDEANDVFPHDPNAEPEEQSITAQNKKVYIWRAKVRKGLIKNPSKEEIKAEYIDTKKMPFYVNKAQAEVIIKEVEDAKKAGDKVETEDTEKRKETEESLKGQALNLAKSIGEAEIDPGDLVKAAVSLTKSAGSGIVTAGDVLGTVQSAVVRDLKDANRIAGESIANWLKRVYEVMTAETDQSTLLPRRSALQGR